MAVYLFIVVAVLVCIAWSRTRNTRGVIRLPPGPRGLPVLGYLPWLDPSHPYKTLTALVKRWGPVFSVRLGSVDCVVLADNETIRDLFSRDAVTGRPPLYLFSEVLEESGIIFSQSETWREQRRFAGLAMRKQGKWSRGRVLLDCQSLRADRARNREVAE